MRDPLTRMMIEVLEAVPLGQRSFVVHYAADDMCSIVSET
jgi:hypothetical protein